MKYNKTIQICIFDENPNGMMMAELSNWNGRVYKISRNEIREFGERKDSEYTGLYFLFGKNDDEENFVYVGEAEHLYTRIKQHYKDKLYWNECVILMSKENGLNKAHVKFLENKFYTLAINAKRAKVINSTIPTCSSISEFDEFMLQEFIENACLMINTLGNKTFEKFAADDVEKRITFQIVAARGANAKANPVSEGFLVLAGSEIATDVTKSISKSLKNLREKLISKGIIKNNMFVSDYVFTSPSLAAAIVMGRNANERTEWKEISSGKTLKDIEEKMGEQ